MTTPVTMSAAYFDAMYQAAADPWGFEDRWYEQRKYAISMALLPAARYRRALEAGCSIGVLTRMLAARCDEVLSCDIAAAAVQAAARRTEDLTHVRVEQRDIPGRWPDGRFDLIVFSEILYYLGNQDLEQALSTRCPLSSRRAPCSPCTGGIRWPTTLGPVTTFTRCWQAAPGWHA